MRIKELIIGFCKGNERYCKFFSRDVHVCVVCVCVCVCVCEMKLDSL